jgi:L-lysine 2,3-aminomutase
MNNRLNQGILIFAFIIIALWVCMTSRNKWVRNEKYSADKVYILKHINTAKEVNPILVQATLARLTTDKNVWQEAYDLAVNDRRKTLTTLIENL